MEQETIKGILIDPDNQEIKWVEFPNNLEGYYKLLDCELIDRVAFDDYNDLVVDDEGLYKGHNTFFSIDGLEGHYVGKSVIVGVDLKEWEWTDAVIDEDKLHVHFYKRKQDDTTKSKN